MAPREIWTFDTQHIGQRVLVFDSLESTNDTAASLAHDSANFGSLILADRQTKGRGQHGRSWHGSTGRSLLISILLEPRIARPVLLTAWVAVSVRQAIRELADCDARIKWPNDLLVDGKKICGILIEQSRAIVIGLGLNANQTHEEFQAAELPLATSFLLLTGRTFEIRDVLNSLVQNLDRGYSQLLAGDRDGLERAWIAGLGLMGRHVEVELSDGERLSGRLREISFDALELELGEGVFRVLVAEYITRIGVMGV